MNMASPQRRPPAQKDCDMFDGLFEELLQKQFPKTGHSSAFKKGGGSKVTVFIKQLIFLVTVITLVLAIAMYAIQTMVEQELKGNISKAKLLGYETHHDAHFGSLRTAIPNLFRGFKYNGRKANAEQALEAVGDLCPSLFSCKPGAYYKTIESYCQNRMTNTLMELGPVCSGFGYKDMVANIFSFLISPLIAGVKLSQGKKWEAAMTMLYGYTGLMKINILNIPCRVAVMLYANSMFPIVLNCIWSFVTMGLSIRSRRAAATSADTILQLKDSLEHMQNKLDTLIESTKVPDTFLDVLRGILPPASQRALAEEVQQGQDIRQALLLLLEGATLPAAQVKPNVTNSKIRTQTQTQKQIQTRSKKPPTIAKTYETRSRTKKVIQ